MKIQVPISHFQKERFCCIDVVWSRCPPLTEIKCRGRNLYLTCGRQGPTLVVRGHFLEMTYQEDTLKGVVCKKRSPPFIKRVIKGARFTSQKSYLKASSLRDFSSRVQCLYCLYRSSLFCPKDFSLTRSSIKQRKG